MHPKLPIWQTLFTSFALFRRHFGFAVRISWPFWAALAATTIYFGFTTTPEQAPDLFSSVSVGLIQGLFFCFVAVYWHRNILLHETRAPAVPVRFDSPLRWYVAYAVVLLLIILVFSIMIGIGAYEFVMIVGGVNDIVAGLIIAAGTVAGAVLGSRTSLVLPAAAVGNREIGILRSWQITRGNTWRLIGLFLMLLVSGFFIGFILGFVGGAIDGVAKVAWGVTTGWFVMMGQLISGWIMTVITLGSISLAYAFLVRGESSLLRDETTAVPA